MTRALSLVLALCAVSGFVACDQEENRPPAAETGGRGPGGGGGGGGTPAADAGAVASDAGDASASCNSVTVTGPAVDQLAVAEGAPAGTGGALTDGTYDLSDARIYGSTGAGPTGISYRGALVVDTTAATMQRVIVTAAQVGQQIEARASLRYVASGTTVAAEVACPAGRGSEQLSFTATATTLILTNLVTRESYSFTRR